MTWVKIVRLRKPSPASLFLFQALLVFMVDAQSRIPGIDQRIPSSGYATARSSSEITESDNSFPLLTTEDQLYDSDSWNFHSDRAESSRSTQDTDNVSYIAYPAGTDHPDAGRMTRVSDG